MNRIKWFLARFAVMGFSVHFLNGAQPLNIALVLIAVWTMGFVEGIFDERK